MSTVPKLSEAILQGYNESHENGFRFTNLFWLDKDGDEDRCAGCALGLGFYAMEHREEISQPFDLLLLYWPWTLAFEQNGLGFAEAITQKFENVLLGYSTMEDLIEWVRRIEPKEEVVAMPVEEPVLVPFAA